MKTKRFILLAILSATLWGAYAGELSAYDRQIVASCLVLEAGCDGAQGMQAVLNVILTRADGFLHRLIPETIKSGAFSCMSSIWNSSAPNYSPLIRRAQNQSTVYSQALQLISVMERGLLWDNTYGANHYHASSIRPYWVNEMSYITTIGGHHFYTDRNQRYATL